MPNPFTSLRQKARQLRAALTTKAAPEPKSGFFLHDPAASRPHNLDDAFFDPNVQKRVADVIARAARKKPDEKAS